MEELQQQKGYRSNSGGRVSYFRFQRHGANSTGDWHFRFVLFRSDLEFCSPDNGNTRKARSCKLDWLQSCLKCRIEETCCSSFKGQLIGSKKIRIKMLATKKSTSQKGFYSTFVSMTYFSFESESLVLKWSTLVR